MQSIFLLSVGLLIIIPHSHSNPVYLLLVLLHAQRTDTDVTGLHGVPNVPYIKYCLKVRIFPHCHPQAYPRISLSVPEERARTWRIGWIPRLSVLALRSTRCGSHSGFLAPLSTALIYILFLFTNVLIFQKYAMNVMECVQQTDIFAVILMHLSSLVVITFSSACPLRRCAWMEYRDCLQISWRRANIALE